MLSASIPLSSAPKGTFSAGNEVAVATESSAVNSSDDALEKNGQEQKGASAAEQSTELFSGQLQKALNGSVEVFPLEVATLANPQESMQEGVTAEQHSTQLESNPAQQLDGEQALNPEQWLQAMLDQQQLRLHTRDASAATVANTESEPMQAAETVAATKATVAVANSVVLSSSTPTTGQGTGQSIDPQLAQSAEQFTSHSISQSISQSTDQSNSQSINQSINQSITQSTHHHMQTVQQSASQANALAAELPVKNMHPANANTAQSSVVTDADTVKSNSVLVSTSGANNSSMNSLASFAKIAAHELGANDVSAVQSSASLVAGVDSAQRNQLAQLTSASNLQTPEAKWGEQLLHTLRDNVQLQIQQKIQNATIRLDPPELGSLEIYLSHEGGRLQVQITASQADVARLIQQTSERLRQELSGPQFTQVNIQTSAEGQSGQQQSRERQRFVNNEFILANEQGFVDAKTQTKPASDVLVSV